MRQNFTIFAAVSVITLFLLTVGRADAAPITYSETTTASGTLGTKTFTNSLVTLSFSGDTATAISPAPGFVLNGVGTASITIAGVGTGVFNAGGQSTLDFQGMNGVGIGASSLDPSVDQSGQTYVLATNNAAFATYDLASAIGPIVGPAVFRPGLGFSTDAGDLALTTAGDVTFTATVGATAVPEPVSLVLLGTALVGIGLTRRRRKVG